MSVANSNPQIEMGLDYEEIQLTTSNGHPIKGIISRLFLPMLWKRQTGYDWRNHPIQNVFTKKIDIPVLFWHGTSDRDAFYEVTKNMFVNQLHSLTDLMTVTEGEHVELHTIVGENKYNQLTFEWMESVREHRLVQQTGTRS